MQEEISLPILQTLIIMIIVECYEQLYANKVDNLGEMNKFFEKYNLPKRTEEKLENQIIFYLLRYICNQKLVTKITAVPESFTSDSTKHLRKK